MADSIVNIRLSTAETQILIDLYKGHEALWDYSNKLYKSRGAKAASYRSIQLAFQAATGMLLPVTVLKTKLQSFRTSFGKELNLVMRSNQTGKEAYIPKYEHYQRLTFLKGVLCQKKWKQDGQNATPTTQSTSSTQSLEEQQQHNRGVQEFTIYSSPPGHHHLNDDDDDNNNNDISENLSCDLSCDSIPDDKLMLRGLIAQNNGLAQQGLRDLSSTSHPQEHDPDQVSQGNVRLSPNPTHGFDPHAPSRPQGADQELFLPLLRVQSMNKKAPPQQNNASGWRPNQQSRKRACSNVELEEEDDDVSEDMSFSRTCQQEAEEEEGVESREREAMHSLVTYLVEHMRQQENRQREKEARKRVKRSTGGHQRSEDKLWARFLVQQLGEIANEKKRKLLKLKISQMVLDCRMEELEKE